MSNIIGKINQCSSDLTELFNKYSGDPVLQCLVIARIKEDLSEASASITELLSRINELTEKLECERSEKHYQYGRAESMLRRESDLSKALAVKDEKIRELESYIDKSAHRIMRVELAEEFSSRPKLTLIKEIRILTGCGLVEAKRWVEGMMLGVVYDLNIDTRNTEIMNSGLFIFTPLERTPDADSQQD